MPTEDRRILIDVYHKMGNIEARLDDILEIKKAVKSAESKADTALLLANQSTQKLEDMEKESRIQKRWVIGTVLGGFFSSASLVITVITIV